MRILSFVGVVAVGLILLAIVFLARACGEQGLLILGGK